ncbi:MAG: biotin-dependent carboxyltransferase family protein [Albidovulum sp.]
MTCTLNILRAGPGLSVQDLGRSRLTANGLSRGGAADRLALVEAAALLALPAPIAAIEMAGMGGDFTVTTQTRIALTGAPMRATLDGRSLRWNAVHTVDPGQRLSIGGVEMGVFGYLTLAGGILTPEWQGSRAAHLAAGIGARLQSGDCLPYDADPRLDAPPRLLPVDDRFQGGTIRIMPGPQTALFSSEIWQQFLTTSFQRGTEANRQGVKLSHDGAPFGTALANGIASDFIEMGDVQMTGDGIPYVLLSECQTTGGYPRIGTVIEADLPRIAQAPAGASLRFAAVSGIEADHLTRSCASQLHDLRGRTQALIRDPGTLHDLLSYQLISGATAGDDLERASND